ncbi:MAG: protein kinase [Myxococcota bacterium]
MGSYRVGAFELLRPAGQGGMGLVFEARHTTLGTPVAVKVLSADLGAEALQGFQNEIVAMAALDHPNIARVLDHGVLSEPSPHGLSAGAPWFALEFCSSDLRRELLRVESWVPIRVALDTLMSALAYAHARGVVHRDLKPSNILFALPDDLRPGMKLADFGIAIFEGAASSHGSFGTPLFMAPEQYDESGTPFGPWTDLYAVGVLLWRLITGKRPFPASTYEVLFDRKNRGDIGPFEPRFAPPPGLEAWLRQCLQPHPRDRFSCVADALAALDGTPGPAPVPESWTREDPPVPPAQMVGAGLSLVALRRPAFLGRGEERDTLWAHLSMADGGRMSRVWLDGEPGVGASTLGRWLVQAARERSGVVAGEVCAEPGDVPGTAVVRLLESALGLGWGEPSTRVARGRAALARLGLDGQEAVCDLALAERTLEPGVRHGAALAVLSAICQERTLLLFADDVDLDPDLAELVRRAVLELPRRSLLVCRGGPVPGPGWQTLPVDPLPRRVLSGALDYLLPFEAQANGAIVDEARGRPAVAVQLVHHLARAGRIEPGPHGYGFTGTLQTGRDDVGPLLDRLDAPGRAALARACVLGPSVDRRVWWASCADLAVTPGALEEAWQRAGLLRPQPGGFAFQPELHAALLRQVRRDPDHPAHCRACALALEGLDGDPLAIGRAWMSAGEAERGTRAWLAGWDAILVEQGATLSLGLAREAGEAIAALPLQESLHGRLWNCEVVCLRLLDGSDAAEERSREIFRIAMREGWSAEAGIAAWNLGNSLHEQPRRALHALQRGLDVLGDRDEPYVRGLLHYRMHVSSMLLGEAGPGLAHAEQAFLAFDRATGVRARDYAHRAALELAQGRGDLEEALLHARACVQLAREGSMGGLASRLNREADLLMRLGELEEASDVLQEAVDFHRMFGEDSGRADSLVNRMVCIARLGRWDEVPSLAEATLRSSPGNHVARACALFHGVALGHLGQWPAARAHLDDVLEWLGGPHRVEADFAFILDSLAELDTAPGDLAERARVLAESEHAALQGDRA